MFFESSGFRIFSIADIDVSVSMWYAILMVMIVVLNPGLGGVMLALAITASVLIHEFGHAAVSKRYDLAPSILLHGFGGLCTHRPADSDGKDIAIVVAGPLVEIAFGLAAFAALWFLPVASVGGVGGVALSTFLNYFAWVSIVWGAANLVLPLWPLDGGQLFHLILRRFLPEAKAQEWALKVSVTAAIPVGIAGLVLGHFFIAFLALFIIMGNVQALRAGAALVDRRAKVRVSDFGKDLMKDAEDAFGAGDWREAYRLCHQLRASESQIPRKMLDRIFTILGLTAVELGESDEALGWLDKAPESAEVREARQRATAGLD